MTRYEEQGLLLAKVSKELKQQQANNISYQRARVDQPYRPPSMRDNHRTRLIAGNNQSFDHGHHQDTKAKLETTSVHLAVPLVQLPIQPMPL